MLDVFFSIAMLLLPKCKLCKLHYWDLVDHLLGYHFHIPFIPLKIQKNPHQFAPKLTVFFFKASEPGRVFEGNTLRWESKASYRGSNPNKMRSNEPRKKNSPTFHEILVGG